jgi:hypothetical protein
MGIRHRVGTWRQRWRERRIREKAAAREARERVEQADRDVNLAGLKKNPGGGPGGVSF